MAGSDNHDNGESSQLDKLRKNAYTDPGGTTVADVSAARDLAIPVGRNIMLEVTEGPRKGLKFEFKKGNVVIGRGADADLTIDDDKISRKHCIIEAFARDLVFISDLASTNGTSINGMQVRSTKLKDGDKIGVGNSTMILHVEDE